MPAERLTQFGLQPLDKILDIGLGITSQHNVEAGAARQCSCVRPLFGGARQRGPHLVQQGVDLC